MGRLRNPNDLIRIEDAIKVLCRKTCHPGIACPDIYCKEMWDEFEDVERVDAVPVVHGRWNCSDDVYESAVCSVCGWDTVEPWVHIKEWFEFCPHCGAKMDGKGDGNG